MDNPRGASTSSSRTTPTSTTTGSRWSFINYIYFKSIPGILKLLELAFGIVCIISATPAIFDGTYFLLVVAYFVLITTTIWAILILLRIHTRVTLKYSWTTLELGYVVGACVAYALATTTQFSIYTNYTFITTYGSDPKPRSIISAIFALLNTLAYGAGSFFAFKEWKLSGHASTNNHA